jgi:peroxiredoxin
MIALGTKAPEFYLKNMQSGTESFSFANLKEKGTLIFICNCPFVLHVIEEVVMISNDYKVQGLGVVINVVKNYPQDAPELMREFAFENNFDFPYLYDETQEVGAYNAAYP